LFSVGYTCTHTYTSLESCLKKEKSRNVGPCSDPEMFFFVCFICGSLCSHGAYSEADAARLVREVASALSFLHGLGCVHGDLKPENLMLSSENPSDAVIKVVDFGCAQIVDTTSPFCDGQAVAALTPGYSPPEVVHGNTTHKSCPVQPSIDMFSLGVIIYIMLTGVHPFDVMGDATEEEINRNVCSKMGPPLRGTPYTKHLSPSAIDLIEKLIRSNPKKRLTSMQMLEHPWVTGETAATRIIADSDKRLKKYRAFKSRLEAKVFASMVEWSEQLAENDVAKRTSLIERSFKMLDPEHRGYITTKALTKELNPENAGDASNEEDDQLSLSGFSDLLSENMKNRYFPAGHTIYREGDIGHKMYFINSGRVEVSTKDGFRTISEQGNFFGEGALLSKSSTRSATIKCLTPVHALEITREYFEKYMAGGYDLQLSLREKDKNRKYDRAKAILKMQLNMEKRTIQKGEYIYQVGQEGKEIYVLENGKVAVIVEDHVVFELQPGELCGEYSLTFGRPRNTSAKCLSDSCQYHVLHAADFYKVLKEHPAVQDSIRDVCLRREFQKAVVFTTKKSFPTKERELYEAFNVADENRSGNLDLSDIKSMLQRMDATFTDEDIRAILESLDLDGSGAVSFEEFKRMFQS
jgi:serine/threonine protein kinase